MRPPDQDSAWTNLESAFYRTPITIGAQDESLKDDLALVGHPFILVAGWIENMNAGLRIARRNQQLDGLGRSDERLLGRYLESHGNTLQAARVRRPSFSRHLDTGIRAHGCIVS